MYLFSLLLSEPLLLFTRLKVEAQSQNVEITSPTHKGKQVHGTLNHKGLIIDVEHSPPAQFLIRAKEECGTTHPPQPLFFAECPCLDRESATVSTSSEALDQFSHILITMGASN